jgi:hypothetical protein
MMPFPVNNMKQKGQDQMTICQEITTTSKSQQQEAALLAAGMDLKQQDGKDQGSTRWNKNGNTGYDLDKIPPVNFPVILSGHNRPVQH